MVDIVILPIRYGAVRLAPKLVWYADFTPDRRSVPAPEQSKRFDFAPAPEEKP